MQVVQLNSTREHSLEKSVTDELVTNILRLVIIVAVPIWNQVSVELQTRK